MLMLTMQSDFEQFSSDMQQQLLHEGQVQLLQEHLQIQGNFCPLLLLLVGNGVGLRPQEVQLL